MRLASAYMAWRQVQKLSRADRRYSVLPAMRALKGVAVRVGHAGHDDARITTSTAARQPLGLRPRSSA